MGEDDANDFRVPRSFIHDKVGYKVKSRFNREALEKGFKSFKIIERDPSVFPYVNMSARVDFPVVEGLEGFNAAMNTLPYPGGVLNIFRFMRIGGGKVFVFKG